MRTHLADRLNAARRKQFVGRREELQQFSAALRADELPFCLYYLHGQGGVGKTTLLHEFIAICEQNAVPTVYLDGRNIEPGADAFLEALRQTLALPEGDDPLDFLYSENRRRVLFVDTCEELAELDAWLHGVFCSQLPDDTLLVFASRLPPSARWTSDLGWQTLLRAVNLTNLPPEEARIYLEKRAVPPDQYRPVLDFTQGHPLALSLVADVFTQRGAFHFAPEAAPDMIQILLERFVQEIPDRKFRASLEACAVVRLLNEPLLAFLLEIEDAQPLFDWLHRLSFIEAGRYGLFPHDLTRKALRADLRWRSPERFAELRERAGRYYAARLQQTTGQEQQRLLASYFFLNRDDPALRGFFAWNDVSEVIADALRPEDLPALRAMTARHEGEESAQIAEYWLSRRPQWASVVRYSEAKPTADNTDRNENRNENKSEGGSGPLGFLLTIPLQEVSEAEAALDPAIPAARNHLEKTFPLRSGEFAIIYRFWMARETYQDVSPTQSLLFVNMVRRNLTTPGLAFSYCPCADPAFWQDVFAYTEIRRLPDADFDAGGKRYGMYGQDWRVLPPTAWQTLMLKKAFLSEHSPAPTATPLHLFEEADFAAAIRDALRGLSEPDSLRGNPLLRSRLIQSQVSADAGNAERIETLRALIREAIQSLESSPRLSKCYRALHLTYVQPAATQEQAAERLDLPFSTYRRHLTEGVARVTETLWRREIGA